MKKRKPTYQELEKRLAIAEPIVEALKRHEVDAVVGDEKIAFLLLQGVEDALLHSDAAFRAMFDLGGIGMIQADTPSLRLTRVNRKFCEITGYSARELLTKTYIGLTHPDDCRSGLNELARVLRGQTDSWSIEKRFIRKDGSAVRVVVHGGVLRDDTGKAVGIVAMIRDLGDSGRVGTAHHRPAPEHGGLNSGRVGTAHHRPAPKHGGLNSGRVGTAHHPPAPEHGGLKKTAARKGGHQ